MNATQPYEAVSKKYISKLPPELIPSDNSYLTSTFPRIAILGEYRVQEINSMLKAGRSALYIASVIQKEWQVNTDITPAALSGVVGRFRAVNVPMVAIDTDGMSKQERNLHNKRFKRLEELYESLDDRINKEMAKINAVFEKEKLEGKTRPTNTRRIVKLSHLLKQSHDICIELYGPIIDSK